MKMRAALLLLGALLFSITTLAHNGMEHVMGTVKNIAGNAVTVETVGKESKSVTVALLPSTKFMKSGAAASVADLKVGDRVMIEAKEGANEKLEAASIAFGKQAPHDSAKVKQ